MCKQRHYDKDLDDDDDILMNMGMDEKKMMKPDSAIEDDDGSDQCYQERSHIYNWYVEVKRDVLKKFGHDNSD